MSTAEMATPALPVTTDGSDIRSYAEQLRQETVGIKFQSTVLGTTRQMNDAQKRQVAALFGADPDYVSGRKKLLNTRHKAWRSVVSVIGSAHRIWKASTYPWPESLGDEKTPKGTRIIARRLIDSLEEKMTSKQGELTAAVNDLQEVWAELCDESAKKLDKLHMSADYPESVVGLFAFSHSYCDVNPPDWMLQMHPDVYRREEERVREQCEQAILAHEQGVAAQLNQLVAGMLEKLTPGEDGKVKKFTKPNLENFSAFFETFREMRIGNSEELDMAVLRAQEALHGVTRDQLNQDATVRADMQQSMENLRDQLGGMITTRPSRRIVVNVTDPQEETTETDNQESA